MQVLIALPQPVIVWHTDTRTWHPEANSSGPIWL